MADEIGKLEGRTVLGEASEMDLPGEGAKRSNQLESSPARSVTGGDHDQRKAGRRAFARGGVWRPWRACEAATGCGSGGGIPAVRGVHDRNRSRRSSRPSFSGWGSHPRSTSHRSDRRISRFVPGRTRRSGRPVSPRPRRGGSAACCDTEAGTTPRQEAARDEPSRRFDSTADHAEVSARRSGASQAAG